MRLFYLSGKPEKGVPVYESGLFWGSVSLAASIVLVVLAATLKDLRWLLVVACALTMVPIWLACKEVKSKVRYPAFFFLSLVVIAGFTFLGTRLNPAPIVPPKNAQISVTKIVGVFVANKQTKQQGFALNVYYRNSGTGVITEGVSHRAISYTSETALNSEEIEKNQQLASQVPVTSDPSNEIEADSSDIFFTVPNGDGDIVKMEPEARKVLAGKEKMYLFLAFKYADKSLPPNKVRLTELCRWAEGNFEAWHFCGVNRTTIVNAQP